jgi:hypothetical protein
MYFEAFENQHCLLLSFLSSNVDYLMLKDVLLFPCQFYLYENYFISQFELFLLVFFDLPVKQ